MWTAIVVTCPHSCWTEALEGELNLLREVGEAEADVVLVVPDPDDRAGVGSGGATLNALLVVTEHLSARRGHTTITPELLSDAQISIIHLGPTIFPVPSGLLYVDEGRGLPDTTLPATNLQRIVGLCRQLTRSGPAGVMVASADILLTGELQLEQGWSLSGDLALMTVPAPLDVAAHHGVAVLEPDGRVKNVIYQPSVRELTELGHLESADILSGLVWMSQPVAESLLKLHCLSPVDGCTYMGADSGENALQMSLFYDILTATVSGVTSEEFLEGECGKTLTRGRTRSPAMVAARRQVLAELSTYKMHGTRLGMRHTYLPVLGSLQDSELMRCWERLPKFGYGDCWVTRAQGNCFMIDSELSPNKDCRDIFIGCDLADAQEEIYPEMSKDARCVVINYRLSDDDSVTVKFGLQDPLYKVYTADDATLFGRPWSRLLAEKLLNADSLWQQVPASKRCLATARLFNSKKGKQMSLMEAGQMVCLSASLERRGRLHSRIVCQSVEDLLSVPVNCKYIQIFKLAVAKGWHLELLSSLDKAAAKVAAMQSGPERTGRLAQVLATIADLLGTMARGLGGLRSGPALNKSFENGFLLLDKDQPLEGLAALAAARGGWLKRPDKMVRAARHYEGAVQLLVRKTVMSANEHVNVDLVNVASRPTLGVAAVASCPARIDLSGGWTDTPPVCYELGGQVVDLAIKVDGQKPIGCRAVRTEALHLCIQLGSGETVSVRSMADLADFCNPTAPGALVKCCFLAAGVVSMSAGETLERQLTSTCGGGLEVSLWSNLPQGSGLGTSSILAGAVIAAVWSAAGAAYTRSDLVHAVLVVEQLLTTGGGWQDQVGGLYPALCLGSSPSDHRVRVTAEPLASSEGFLSDLEGRLLLLYTGKPRLAKNLLQNVVRNWYSKDRSIVGCFRSNYELAGECWAAVKEENLSRLGSCLDRYWAIKRTLAPGSEPALVRSVMDALQPHVLGTSLAGAGGGGFLVAILRDPADRDRAVEAVAKLEGSSSSRISFHAATVDRKGLEVKLGDQQIDVGF